MRVAKPVYLCARVAQNSDGRLASRRARAVRAKLKCSLAGLTRPRAAQDAREGLWSEQFTILNPGNLPDSEVTSKVNKQIRHFWSQNDCLSKNSLPHQEVNSNPLTFENNPKKLVLHCFRRPQKNNFNQELCLRFRPIRGRGRVEGLLNQSESTLVMKVSWRPFPNFRFHLTDLFQLS